MSRPAELSQRDRTILRFVHEIGLASARQVEILAFQPSASDETSALSAARRCRRVLRRLADDDYLNRLERRVGGVRAGSAGHLYQLATAGKRALGITGRGRTWEPGSRYVDHALAAGDLHVALVAAERTGHIDRVRILHEPATWRRFGRGTSLVTLKPDLLVELSTRDGTGGLWELRWFVEIDRATEHLPTVLAKCRTYEQYWRSGRESERHEVFPRVLWSVPHRRRAEAIAAAVRGSPQLTNELFAVAEAPDAVAVITNQSKGGHL